MAKGTAIAFQTLPFTPVATWNRTSFRLDTYMSIRYCIEMNGMMNLRAFFVWDQHTSLAVYCSRIDPRCGFHAFLPPSHGIVFVLDLRKIEHTAAVEVAS